MAELNLLTVSQVADQLNVHPKTVRDLIKRGELPAHKIGKVYRIRDTEFADYFMSTATAKRISDG